MSEIGFKIYDKFYPVVARDDWTVDETRASRLVAGLPLDQLVQEGDHMMINITFALPAWWRGNPQASEADARTLIGSLKPKDWAFVGGASDGDAGPPDETPGGDSSESIEPSSESTQEKSDPPTSGVPDSPPTGISGPPSQSES